MPRKSRDVYAVITDFSLQYQRSEKTGTELGKPWAAPAPVPVLLARSGRAHTRQRDRPMPGARRRRLPPSQQAGPRLRASVLAAAHATVPPDLYGAWRVAALRDAGAWEMRDAAMAYTCARSTRSMRRRALAGGPCVPGCTRLRPGAPAGAAMAYTFRPGEGCAGRFASGRGVDRPAAYRTAPGSGCPLRPQRPTRRERLGG